MTEEWSPNQISCSLNGTEVTSLVSFEWSGDNTEVSVVKGIHGATHHQEKYTEPSAKIVVNYDSNIIPVVRSLQESKLNFSVTFCTPAETVTCYDCRVAKVESGTQSESAPEYSISLVPLKIEVGSVA